jgi:hypothetical protein
MSLDIDLMLPEEAQAKVRQRMDSRDYWILLVPMGCDSSLSDIEKEFYSGKKSSPDFELILGPLNIACAHKRWMTQEQLFHLLKTKHKVTQPIAEKPDADILVLAFQMSSQEQFAVLGWFAQWLKQPAGGGK